MTMPARFPDHRFRAAGGTRAQIKKAGEFWNALDEQERQALADELSAVSNDRVLEVLQDFEAAEGTEYGTPTADDEPDQPGGEPDEDDQPDQPNELDEALDTVASAETYAQAHPDTVPQLLQREQAGKARKTLLEALQRLQEPDRE